MPVDLTKPETTTLQVRRRSSVSVSRRQISDDILELVKDERRSDSEEENCNNNVATVQMCFLTARSSRATDLPNLQRHYYDGLLKCVKKLVFYRHRRSCVRLLMQSPLYIVSLCLLFAASWAFFGLDALPPEGSVFSILILYVTAVMGGWFMQFIKLPPLLGQLIAGIVVRNMPFIRITTYEHESIRWSSPIRMLALTVILLRAGLGLDATALKKLKGSVLLLGVVPVSVEATGYAVLTHYLMQFPWDWGFLLGFVLSAVSPAVIVPSMLYLQETGLGVAKGIPTLIMAASSFDDVFAIAGVGVTLSIIFSTNGNDDLVWQFFQGPLEIVGGIMYGAAVGCLMWFIPSNTVIADSAAERVRAFRTALLCGFGVLAVFGSQKLSFTGGGALGCLTAAFVAALGWRRNDSAASEGEVIASSSVMFTANLLAAIWKVILQPMLFALIGAEIAFTRLEVNSLGIGLVILSMALIMRLLASVAAVSVNVNGGGARLEWKERAFVALAWIPKATVQAAVGPLAYDTARRLGRSEAELMLGLKVLTFAVLVILITAPLGAVAISLSCNKLLKKNDDDPNGNVLLHKNDDVAISTTKQTGGAAFNAASFSRNDTRESVIQLDVIDGNSDVEAFGGGVKR